jgi:hypothetical protein
MLLLAKCICLGACLCAATASGASFYIYLNSCFHDMNDVVVQVIPYKKCDDDHDDDEYNISI